MLALATRPDSSNAFKNFDIPVLILVGRNDVLTPAVCSYNIKDSFIKSEMEFIENAGHLSNLENPASFNNHLKRFLEKQR